MCMVLPHNVDVVQDLSIRRDSLPVVCGRLKRALGGIVKEERGLPRRIKVGGSPPSAED